MGNQPPSNECRLELDDPLRILLEGTATATGERFFEVLVENLARTLKTKYAWITEYIPDRRRLRALAFWVDGKLEPDFEVDIDDTPCEAVIEKSQLVLYPDNIRELFPRSAKLEELGAVSYMGVPLTDLNRSILGHLAVIDDQPMPDEPRRLTLFRIFAARAAVELQRIRAESDAVEREEKLSRLVSSAMDAIIELDNELNIVLMNSAAEKLLKARLHEKEGNNFLQPLSADSQHKFKELLRKLTFHAPGEKYFWIPGGFKVIDSAGNHISTDATISQFEMKGRSFYTLILRNINERIEAERKIEILNEEATYLRREINALGNFNKIVGRSQSIREVLRNVEKVAKTDTTVLILGETGTGKELIARAIHTASLRRDNAFITVNCAAIPASLMESEFFGHEKGAFTGAGQRKEGLISLADGGTIFLDEIGELDKEIQAKLLRVLQEGEYTSVGSSQPRRSNARVIAATNCDLSLAVQEHKFRTDLYYRLNVFPITIPPLRQRGDDIRLLAEHFVKQFSIRLGRTIKPLGTENVERLGSYDWPGNVRELRNVIERGIITASNGRLNLDHALPETNKVKNITMPTYPIKRVKTIKQLRQDERENILMALEQSHWRVAGKKGAAQMLGLPPSTFQSRMKALGIKRPH